MSKFPHGVLPYNYSPISKFTGSSAKSFLKGIEPWLYSIDCHERDYVHMPFINNSSVIILW